MFVCVYRSSPVAQRLRICWSLLLWLGFDSLPRNFCVLWVQPKKMVVYKKLNQILLAILIQKNVVITYLFFFFLWLFRPALMEYGSSQAKG